MNDRKRANQVNGSNHLGILLGCPMELFPDRNESGVRQIRKPVHRPSNNVIVILSMAICYGIGSGVGCAIFVSDPYLVAEYDQGETMQFQELIGGCGGFGLALGAIIGNVIIYLRNKSVGFTTSSDPNLTNSNFTTKFHEGKASSSRSNPNGVGKREEEQRVIGIDTHPNAQQCVPTEE